MKFGECLFYCKIESVAVVVTVVIRDCKVIRDAQTHQSKGYAFVCFVRQEVLLAVQFIHLLPAVQFIDLLLVA